MSIFGLVWGMEIGKEKSCGGVDEWWVTYSTALSPSINLMTTDRHDCYADLHSSIQPPPLLPAYPLLFHLSTQTLHAHAKEIKIKLKHIYKFSVCFLRKESHEKPSRGVVWHTPKFSLTWMREIFRSCPSLLSTSCYLLHARTPNAFFFVFLPFFSFWSIFSRKRWKKIKFFKKIISFLSLTWGNREASRGFIWHQGMFFHLTTFPSFLPRFTFPFISFRQRPSLHLGFSLLSYFSIFILSFIFLSLYIDIERKIIHIM